MHEHAITAPRPRRRRTRMRWDRVGRAAMLFVLCVLVYLYIGPAITLLSDVGQAAARHRQVLALERTHRQLRAREALLARPSTLEAQARNLGLVLPGEREYVVRGLPDN